MKKKEDIEFLFKRLPPFSNEVLKSYENLPLDQYLQTEQKFRQRRFSEVIFKDGNIIIEKKKHFFQEPDINHYAGGMERSYEPIGSSPLDEFVKIYLKYVNPVFYNNDSEIGFHQIRITCNDDYVGHPVPEGWHVDGFDYVAIACIAGFNFLGGTSRIKANLSLDHDTYSKILQPSEIIIFNDRKYFHHTDPINNAESEVMGYRDILVITIRFI